MGEGIPLTLREFLRILWLEKWVVVASVVVVVAGAAFYHHRSVPVFESTTTVVLNPSLTGSGQNGSGGMLTLDDTVVSQTSILQAASKQAGVSAQELAGEVSASSPSAGTVVIKASAHSPTQAQAYAAAVARAVTEAEQALLVEYRGRLDSSQQTLSQQINTLQTKYDATVRAGNGDVLLQAQLNLAVQQYQSLVGQINTAQAVSNAASITVTASPGKLTSTSLTTLLELAILAGLVAGAGIAVIRFWLFGRVVTAPDVRAAIPSAVLGSVPRRKGRNIGMLLIAATGPDGDVSVESFRVLRTGALALLRNTGGSVALVTGTRNGDGASYVATNLAASVARAGQAITIADGDLRGRALAAYFDRSDSGSGPSTPTTVSAAADEPGVGRESTGHRRGGHRGGAARAAVGEAISPPPTKPMATDVENLSWVRSLVAETEGTDALAGQQVQSLLAELRDQSDFVLIDTPPLLEVADPLVIAAHVDAVLLVVRSRRTKIREVSRAISRLERAGVGSVGVIVNGVHTREARSALRGNT